jgi:hypothetical protein
MYMDMDWIWLAVQIFCFPIELVSLLGDVIPGI